MRALLLLLVLLVASPAPVPSSQRAALAITEATPRVLKVPEGHGVQRAEAS